MIDNKESVIQFELTDIGKDKLADGKLNFSYYSFSDEDILYNSQYTGYQEDQNEIQPRILTTPRGDLNPRIEGADTIIKFNDSGSKANSLGASIMLGTSDFSNQKAPKWNLSVWSGYISSSANVYEDQSHFYYARVPQVNMNIQKYTVSKITNIPTEVIDELAFSGLDHTFSDGSIVTEDGTIVEVVEKDLFIEIEEINSLFSNTNFDLEVYEIHEVVDRRTNTTTETYKPLYFSTKPKQQSDLFIEDSGFSESIDNLSDDMVENYFIIECDGEIDPEVICKNIPMDRRRGIYDSQYYDCEERQPYVLKFDPQSDVESPDEEEDC